MIIMSSLYVRGHVELSIVWYLVSNQRLYLLNKLKHSGVAEKGFDDIFQAGIV